MRVPLFLIQNTDRTACNFEQYDSSSSHGLWIYKPTNFVSRLSCYLFSQPILQGHWVELLVVNVIVFFLWRYGTNIFAVNYLLVRRYCIHSYCYVIPVLWVLQGSVQWCIKFVSGCQMSEVSPRNINTTFLEMCPTFWLTHTGENFCRSRKE